MLTASSSSALPFSSSASCWRTLEVKEMSLPMLLVQSVAVPTRSEKVVSLIDSCIPVGAIASIEPAALMPSMTNFIDSDLVLNRTMGKAEVQGESTKVALMHPLCKLA